MTSSAERKPSEWDSDLICEDHVFISMYWYTISCEKYYRTIVLCTIVANDVYATEVLYLYWFSITFWSRIKGRPLQLIQTFVFTFSPDVCPSHKQWNKTVSLNAESNPHETYTIHDSSVKIYRPTNESTARLLNVLPLVNITNSNTMHSLVLCHHIAKTWRQNTIAYYAITLYTLILSTHWLFICFSLDCII